MDEHDCSIWKAPPARQIDDLGVLWSGDFHLGRSTGTADESRSCQRQSSWFYKLIGIDSSRHDEEEHHPPENPLDETFTHLLLQSRANLHLRRLEDILPFPIVSHDVFSTPCSMAQQFDLIGEYQRFQAVDLQFIGIDFQRKVGVVDIALHTQAARQTLLRLCKQAFVILLVVFKLPQVIW